MITRAQKIHLMAELWPNACAHQGWDEADKPKRYALFARILGQRDPHKATLAAGRDISCNHFVKTAERDDFGDVKNELLLLAGADLIQDSPTRRTFLWVIEQRLMPCYRVYKAEASLETILRERFGRVKGINTIHDLRDADLEKLIFTIEARVNVARAAAGDTHHGMADRAGVKPWRCARDCWQCAALKQGPDSRAEAQRPQSVETAEDDVEQPF